MIYPDLYVAPIDGSQLEYFANLTSEDGDNGFERLVKHLWATGESRPEWNFVASSQGEIKARIGYVGDIRMPTVLEVFDLSTAWSQEDPGLAAALLDASGKAMAEQGTEVILARLFGHEPDRLRLQEIYRQAGYDLLQERAAFWWPDPWPLVKVPERLTYQSMDEFGEHRMIEVFQDVTHDTLDRVDQLKMARFGVQNHSLQYFDMLRSMNHHSAWWQVGLNGYGSVVGMVAPVLMSPKEGTIGYVGVLPDQRGQGYGRDLLAKGVSILQTRGLDQIHCETDARNRPMIDAFQAVGRFQVDPNGRVWVYRKVLGD